MLLTERKIYCVQLNHISRCLFLIVVMWLINTTGCTENCENNIISDKSTRVPTVHVVDDGGHIYHVQSDIPFENDAYIHIQINTPDTSTFLCTIPAGEVQSFPHTVGSYNIFSRVTVSILPAEGRAKLGRIEVKRSKIIEGKLRSVILLNEHPFQPYTIGEPSSIILYDPQRD